MLHHIFFFFSNLPPVTSTSSQRTKAAVEAVVYHISNESGLIVCIPETAMIHCLALARDQPLNNVYHCLPGLFNYLPSIIDRTARVPVFYDFKGGWVITLQHYVPRKTKPSGFDFTLSAHHCFST